MLAVVAPLFHTYVEPPLAVKVTLDPLQMLVGPPAVIVAVGMVFTTMLIGADVVEHPAAFVTVTVLDPAVVAEIEAVVAPVLHKYDVPALAVKVTLPPEQKLVAPPAVMFATGAAFTVMAVPAEVDEQPEAFVTSNE